MLRGINMKKYKSSVIQTLLVLSKYSDENHILRISEIFHYLAEEFNISIDRRTLYANIDILNQAGVEVSTFSDNGVGYYLLSRIFEPSEVGILCHQVASTGLLTAQYSHDLIEKLLSTQSDYTASSIKQHLVNKYNHKTENNEILLNMELLLDAISLKKMIKIQYNEYNLNKKLVTKKKREFYELHPYHVVISDDLPYLVCRFEDYDDLAFYRIDYMKKVEILPKESKPLDAKFDPYSYVRSHTYMFNGHVEKVKIRCSNTILGYVIEDFGKDIHLEKGDDDHFIATLRSSERGILFWLGRYMNYCEILEPQAYRDKFIESLKSTLLKYE